MENKYTIELVMFDNKTLTFKGVGRPNTTEDEIQIKQENGEEVVVMKNSVIFFTLSRD